MSSPRVRRERAKVAALARHRPPNDPDAIDARRDLAAANIEAYVRRVVDAAPPLTDSQRDRLAALLRPIPGAVGGDAA